MTEPVRIELGADPGAVVGDTDDERAAPRRVRHAGHFFRQIGRGLLVFPLAGGDGPAIASPARLLLDVHPLHFNPAGRLALRQPAQRLLDEHLERILFECLQCHQRPRSRSSSGKGNYTAESMNQLYF